MSRRRNPVLADTRRLTRGRRLRWLPAVWAMLVRTYAEIGVPHRAPSELLADYPAWDVSFDADGQPRAFMLYKRTEKGLKSSASGSDGSLDGRDTIKDMIPRKFRTPGTYGEVSGAVERVVQKARVPAVCTAYVPDVIHKRIEAMPDGLHYAREITGVGRHVKVLVGRPRGVPTTTLEAAACPVPALANPRKRGKRRGRWR